MTIPMGLWVYNIIQPDHGTQGAMVAFRPSAVEGLGRKAGSANVLPLDNQPSRTPAENEHERDPIVQNRMTCDVPASEM